MDIWTQLAVGVIIALLAALATHLLSWRKTKAELLHLESATKLNQKNLEAMGFALASRLPDIKQVQIYDINTSSTFTDFDGVEALEKWDPENRRFTGPKASGTLEFKDNCLIVNRNNKQGRFEIWLRKYSYGKSSNPHLPSDVFLVGKRSLQVKAEIKLTSGSHKLTFIIKDNDGERKWLDFRTVTVSKNEWSPVDISLSVSPDKNCIFRIDDAEPTAETSTLLIRNFSITQLQN